MRLRRAESGRFVRRTRFREAGAGEEERRQADEVTNRTGLSPEAKNFMGSPAFLFCQKYPNHVQSTEEHSWT